MGVLMIQQGYISTCTCTACLEMHGMADYFSAVFVWLTSLHVRRLEPTGQLVSQVIPLPGYRP